MPCGTFKQVKQSMVFSMDILQKFTEKVGVKAVSKSAKMQSHYTWTIYTGDVISPHRDSLDFGTVQHCIVKLMET